VEFKPVHNYTLPHGEVSSNIMAIKPRMMRLRRHVAQMEDFLGDPDYLKNTSEP
jgi:hypothetical protein